MKIEFGKCPFTGKTIATKDGDQVTRLPNLRKYWLGLSDGSRMMLWVDENAKITKKALDELMKTHIEMWEAGLEEAMDKQVEAIEQKRKELKKHYKSLTYIAHGAKERDVE